MGTLRLRLRCETRDTKGKEKSMSIKHRLLEHRANRYGFHAAWSKNQSARATCTAAWKFGKRTTNIEGTYALDWRVWRIWIAEDHFCSYIYYRVSSRWHCVDIGSAICRLLRWHPQSHRNIEIRALRFSLSLSLSLSAIFIESDRCLPCIRLVFIED